MPRSYWWGVRGGACVHGVGACVHGVGSCVYGKPMILVSAPVPLGLIVKLRANRQKTKDKLGPEIGSVMAWPTTTTTTHPITFFEL